MSNQAQLVPSLFALLPADSLELYVSRISLHSLHAEPYHIRDDFYAATNPVIPNQTRVLRLRARKQKKRRPAPQPRWPSVETNVPQDTWEYSMTWVSNPLNGREYQDMMVRAQTGLEAMGMSSREEIEDFIQTMGFKHTHNVSRLGHLFHMPIPGHTSTLHLTITRVFGPDDKPTAQSTEPFLVQLQPARPLNPVAQRGELSFQDAMKVMQNCASRIDGLQWESGRPQQ